jgi:hypothetical protein
VDELLIDPEFEVDVNELVPDDDPVADHGENEED